MKQTKPSNSPINIAIPNTKKEKMAAIVNLSLAVYELSKAINGVNVNVIASNNTITASKTGIAIQYE